MSQKIENARETLLQCGKEFLLRNRDGAAGKFQVRALTAQCGMASGTFYRYFDSKDDLTRQILQADWQKAMKTVDAVMQSDDTLYGKARAIYEEVSAFERNYRHSALELLSGAKENAAFKRDCFSVLQKKMRQFLRIEMQKGALALGGSPDIAAYLLIQLFSATARNPSMDFDDLWACMTFQDTSGAPCAGAKACRQPVTEEKSDAEQAE